MLLVGTWWVDSAWLESDSVGLAVLSLPCCPAPCPTPRPSSRLRLARCFLLVTLVKAAGTSSITARLSRDLCDSTQ